MTISSSSTADLAMKVTEITDIPHKMTEYIINTLVFLFCCCFDVKMYRSIIRRLSCKSKHKLKVQYLEAKKFVGRLPAEKCS